LVKEELTRKEKLTLLGMTRFPACNDRELSEMLKERISTVTSIRRRLKERGFYFKAMLPSFHSMGCGILAACYGGLSRGYVADMRKAVDKGLFQNPESISFLTIVGAFNWFEMAAYKNYSEAKSKGDVFWTRLNEIFPNLPGNPCVHGYYPLETMTIHNFFDHTQLLKTQFRLEEKWDAVMSQLKPPGRKLSNIEKLVFYGLVRHPDSPDKLVAEKLSVSRQAVARIRKLLEKEGFVTPLVVPDLEKLGFEILVLFKFFLNPKNSKKIRDSTVASLLKDIPHIFAASTELECVMLAAYPSFSEFEKGSNRLIRKLDEGSHLEGAPEVQTFSLGDARVLKNHDYIPLTRESLDLPLED
jgi:DNA-binding MarR family transcriptional regulator